MCFQRCVFDLRFVKAVSANGPCIATGCTVIRKSCIPSRWLPPFSGIYRIVWVLTPKQVALWPFPCLNIPRSKPRWSEAGPSADGPAIFWGDSVLKLDFFFPAPIYLQWWRRADKVNRIQRKVSGTQSQHNACLRASVCARILARNVLSQCCKIEDYHYPFIMQFRQLLLSRVTDATNNRH